MKNDQHLEDVVARRDMAEINQQSSVKRWKNTKENRSCKTKTKKNEDKHKGSVREEEDKCKVL